MLEAIVKLNNRVSPATRVLIVTANLFHGRQVLNAESTVSMRIVLVAPGLLHVSPPGWGAVENIVWNHEVYLEQFGHQADVFNTRAIC